jgi:DNA-binding response OmpR family regulator
MRVLIVEDDVDLAANIAEFLAAEGIGAATATDGGRAISQLERDRFSVVLLDVNLPDVSGFALCGEIHALAPRTKVLMLTARDTEFEKLAGFDAGADDYVTKPFSLPELLARIRALARRSAAPGQHLQVADLSLDTRTLHVHRGTKRIELPAAGLRLLERLLEISPGVLTREEAERLLWGRSGIRSEAALRGHIHALRLAIDTGFDHKLLHTVHGVGYRLAPGESR